MPRETHRVEEFAILAERLKLARLDGSYETSFLVGEGPPNDTDADNATAGSIYVDTTSGSAGFYVKESDGPSGEWLRVMDYFTLSADGGASIPVAGGSTLEISGDERELQTSVVDSRLVLANVGPWKNSVIDKDLATSPIPVIGDRYLVAGIGGDWSAGTVGDIAICVDDAGSPSDWEFDTPEEGWILYVQDEDLLYVYDGAAWDIFSSGSSYTDEEAQDAVGNILTDTATIDFDYDDGTPQITASVKVDSINDTHIDWGTGANQVSAADIPIADSGTYYITDNVEAALQEIGLFLASISADFADDVFRISDNGDSTKKIAFEVSGVSASTTRTFTAPNKNGTMAMLDDVTWTITPDLTSGSGDTNVTSGETIVITGDYGVITEFDRSANSLKIKGPTTKNIMLYVKTGLPATTNPAETPTSTEFASNIVNINYSGFDPTTSEGMHWDVIMPSDYDGGTVTARFYYFIQGSPGTLTVTWRVQGRSYGDGESFDQAYGSKVSVTDTVTTTDGSKMLITNETDAMTFSGTPAAGEYVNIRVDRDVADSFSLDARLIAVRLTYGVAA